MKATAEIPLAGGPLSGDGARRMDKTKVHMAETRHQDGPHRVGHISLNSSSSSARGGICMRESPAEDTPTCICFFRCNFTSEARRTLPAHTHE